MKLKDLAGSILRMLSRNKSRQDYLNQKKDDYWDIVLYCDSPECSTPICGNHVAYDPVQQKVYHPQCECEIYGTIYATANSDVRFTSAIYISMENAIELYRRGKLAQATELEKLIRDIEKAEKRKKQG